MPPATLTIPEYQATWANSDLTERAAAQSNFADLCALVGFPPPTVADPTGRDYAFERKVHRRDGRVGYADVWYRDRWAWEYKRRGADLGKAYDQLLGYREELDNPPLLVVTDIDRIDIHTNFTGTPKRVYPIRIEELGEPESFERLVAAFHEPASLRPDVTVERVTEGAAERFGTVAQALHARGVEPLRAAHFMVQVLFCLFAEDVRLLPSGLFSQLLTFDAGAPDRFHEHVQALFAAMRDGGDFALREIPCFNGGLFPRIDPVPLLPAEIAALAESAKVDWKNVEPAVFGTLFERSLDPGQRSALGAHYTGRADIERVVGPVVVEPLRRRWAEVRSRANAQVARRERAGSASARTAARKELAGLLGAFTDELAAVRILDPACGSGNFLYVALSALLDLEQEVSVYAARNGLAALFPVVGPRQLSGLEINPYARELAQAVVWIGYLQWLSGHGYGWREPVLEPLETIRLQDALLDRGDPGKPRAAEWPAADYVIGNPPFLGDKKQRRLLGEDYAADLRRVYGGRLPAQSDLAAYFFEQAREAIAAGKAKRVGLLATQSIRKGASRTALDRISETGAIFAAWSDQPWVLDGAAVRISIVGFDDGSETERRLDGVPVERINPDLTAGIDVTTAKPLPENAGICFQGPVKVGPFELTPEQAALMLAAPLNPNGRQNADVLRPWLNGQDVTGRPRGMNIIDFGPMGEEEAAYFEQPFGYVREHVKPLRDRNADASRRVHWWRLGRSGQDLKTATHTLPRFLCTPRVATHRLFVWVPAGTLPDSRLLAFARADDWFFGVLHSRAHEVWSLAQASRHGKGNDPTYNAADCFETFPLPWPPGMEPPDDPRVLAVAAAARELDERRRLWLDPSGEADPTVLKGRTLTALYNARPAWLAHLHEALDRAVWAAYGWEGEPGSTGDGEMLARLLELNRNRAR